MFGNLYNLDIDLKRKMTSIVPTFVQYDYAVLMIKVFDNGKPFDLAGLTSADVSHKKSDGSIFVGAGTFEKNSNHEDVIRYVYLGNEMDKTGFVETSLTLFSGDCKVSSQPFKVNILPNHNGSVLNVTDNIEVGVTPPSKGSAKLWLDIS